MMIHTPPPHRKALNFAVCAMLVMVHESHAQADAPTPMLPRVEVTGSSMRRIPAESALPVHIIRREDIVRSGASSTTELLQRLPLMQGGISDAVSAGPGAGGYTGAALHEMGEMRTLVLLNGRRLAQFGGQTLSGSASGVDLSAIPLSAIERIEILSDGASSIYGADAVAGVVNFITRRNSRNADASVGYSAPRGGAQEKRWSVSKGWGDLAEDGHNLMLAMSADSREALYANARSYARTGVVDLNYQGQRYRVVQLAGASIPANVLNDDGQVINPYFLSTGTCPPRHLPIRDAVTGSTACAYDFVGDLAMLPARERRSAMGSWTQQLEGDHTLKADVLLSRSESRFQLAPVPGSLLIPAGSSLHDTYLRPVGITQDSVAFYRAADLGPRAGRDVADFAHVALSSQGVWSNWDYQASWAYSRSQAQTRIKGYPGARAFGRLLESGVLNPFVGPGQQSAQGMQALQSIAYDGDWNGGLSSLQSWELRGSRPVAQWRHGPVVWGAGLSQHQEDYASRPSLFAQGRLADPVTGQLASPEQGTVGDVRFGDESTTRPYQAARRVRSGFMELVMPVAATLEMTGSGRLDYYSDVGMARTAKASFRWQPSSGWLFRGSIGSGFRAPTVPQVNASIQSFGSTAGAYDCTTELQQVAQKLGVNCRTNGSQYDVLAGGNGQLKPERSQQLSLGFRVEPHPDWSLGADFWHVGLHDVISQLTEEEAFAHPLRYDHAFASVQEVSTGRKFIAFQALNQNLGKEFRSGIDLDIKTRWRSTWGQWTSQWTVSHLLRQAQQLTPGGPYFSSLGQHAELGKVAFRWQGRWATSVQQQDWRHTMTLFFKSGYRDAPTLVERYNADGQLSGQFDVVRLKVPWFTSWDWQSAWKWGAQTQLVLGVLNVFNRAPPLVISNGGLDRGQNFGYDDRYSDPRGRTLYINLNHQF